MGHGVGRKPAKAWLVARRPPVETHLQSDLEGVLNKARVERAAMEKRLGNTGIPFIVICLIFISSMFFPGGYALAHDPYNLYWNPYGWWDTQWDSVANWTNYNGYIMGVLPGNGDNIYIRNALTATYDLDTDLLVSNIYVTDGATLHQSSTGSLGADTLNLYGNGAYILDQGTFTAGVLQADSNSQVELNNNGKLNVTTAVNLGTSDQGPATFTQNGGVHTLGTYVAGQWGLDGASLNVGYDLSNPGSGSYNLTDGTLDVYGTVYVGRGGSGEFVQGVSGDDQSGGTVTIYYTSASCGPNCYVEGTGSLYVGYAGGQGGYTLNNGKLNVQGNLYIGNGGSITQGYLDGDGNPQGGGVITVGTPNASPTSWGDGMLSVGTGGTYTLYNGQLKTNDTGVSGLMQQYGGTHTISAGPAGSGSLYVMNMYNLVSGNLIVGGNMQVSFSGDNGLPAVFNQGGIDGATLGDGGSVSVGGNLIIGNDFLPGPLYSGVSSYNLYTGDLTVAGDLTLGSATSGKFTQTGGSVTVNNLYLGGSLSGSGAYDLSGDYSTLNVQGTTFVGNPLGWGGPGGSGTFTQSGGAVTTPFLLIGGSGTSGSYTLSGDPNTSTLNATYMSLYSNGSFTQGGGTLNVGGAAQVSSDGVFTQNGGINNSAEVDVSAGGKYALKGGTLNAAPWGIYNSGAFDYTGGVLSASLFENYAGGAFNVSGPAAVKVQADVNIAGGTVNVQNAPNLVFGGNFTLNGAMYTDPSTIKFSKDVTVDANGFIHASAGDRFIIAGDFTNYSTNPLWDTALATLSFQDGKNNNNHHVSLSGAGQQWTSWGTLDISGDVIYLGGAAGSSLFVGELIGANISGGEIANIFGDGHMLYYDPNDPVNKLSFGGKAFLLADGGSLSPFGAPVPIPTPAWLLGSGLAGMAFLKRNGWGKGSGTGQSHEIST